MQFGSNVDVALYWGTPFATNLAEHAEQWWHRPDDNWGPRTPAATMEAGKRYTSFVVSEGVAPAGTYDIDHDVPVSLGRLLLNGQRLQRGTTQYIHGGGEIRMDFLCEQDCLPIEVVFTIQAQGHEGVIRDDWAKAHAPFNECFRAMNATGAYSNRAYAAVELGADRSHSSLLHAAGGDGWSTDGGMRYSMLAEAATNFYTAWVNVPMLLEGEELEKELRTISYEFAGQTVYVSRGNEKWNHALRMGQETYRRSTPFEGDEGVGHTLEALRMDIALLDAIERLGLQDQLKVQFEWQHHGLWAFEWKSWGDKGPVCPEAQQLLQRIGRLAINFYWGDQVTDAADAPAAAQAEVDRLRKTQDLCNRLGVMLHVYEGGQHATRLPHEQQTHPDFLEGWRIGLTGAAAILDPGAIFNIYKPTGGWGRTWNFGLIEDLQDLFDPEARSYPKWQFVMDLAETLNSEVPEPVEPEEPAPEPVEPEEPAPEPEDAVEILDSEVGQLKADVTVLRGDLDALRTALSIEESKRAALTAVVKTFGESLSAIGEVVAGLDLDEEEISG